MHALLHMYPVMHAKHYPLLDYPSLFWLWIIFLPFLLQFISHQSVLTYSQPNGEVSHDTQDADTKISHLIYFGSVYVCQSLFIPLPSFHLYTFQSPCCAHRWYWHMAATFAVFANLALLLQCLFLLPSGLHSALCKCHSSPVVSLRHGKFRVRSVMLSAKYHSNSTQQ